MDRDGLLSASYESLSAPSSSASSSPPPSSSTSPLDRPDDFQKSLNKFTSDQIAKAVELEEKADKKIKRWTLFGWVVWGSDDDEHRDNCQYAASLYKDAVDIYKSTKSWDKEARVYLKLAGCYLKLENSKSKYEAAMAYVHAGDIYKKISAEDAIACFYQAVNQFLEIGYFHMAGLQCEEIGNLYEVEQNMEIAIVYFERAADLFQREESFTFADQCRCKQKVAQFSAQLEQYPRAIAIYEDLAKQFLKENHSKSSVNPRAIARAIAIYEDFAKGYLLNAGLCQLCKADAAAISNALERYEELDPTFLGTCEYKFLADLAASVAEEDVLKFTDVVKKFDNQDSWNTTLLMRIEEKLKVKVMEKLIHLKL